jgi:hypothetical protein
MGTSAMIWVKIPNEYRGYATHKKWNELCVKIGKLPWCKSIKRHRPFMPCLVLDCNYIGIYCHCDGYLNSLGDTLVKVFDNFDKAIGLVNCGYISSLDTNEVKPYCLRTDIKENWEVDKSDDLVCCAEYTYLFENNDWYECHIENGQIVKTLVKKMLGKC